MYTVIAEKKNIKYKKFFLFRKNAEKTFRFFYDDTSMNVTLYHWFKIELQSIIC